MIIEDPLQVIAQFLRRLQWAALAAALVWLLWILSPVLTPFACAAILGWMGDPLVDRLEARGWSRGISVTVVFFVMLLAITVVLLLLVPTIQDQISILVRSLPRYQQWFYQVALPWIEGRFNVRVAEYLDFTHIWGLLRSNWERAGGVAYTLWGYVSRSGFALFGWMANLVLIPVIAFFFLRDWDLIVGRVAAMVPRNQIGVVSRLAGESSEVLGGFLKGQLLVMIILGVLYGAGLWAVGLDLGILIGLIAGLLTFVPYLGPTSGVAMGLIAALMQYGDVKHLVLVSVVFAVGQVIESYVLTPKLVGDRIGLHPVAVIFAVLACGQLFGFLGMLLALPIAAVANVLLRYAHERYTHSQLYAGGQPTILLDPQRTPVDGLHPPQDPSSP
ncbi:AI-2E family transporter [Pseudoxanthomonas winnipegensis]|jgi:predicted PurR-regulated permease PerM|uniref:AI-2E family transporter n=1 Tax=Pseudoxanthomonas winnipegensis TaxID=2480810 RepID=A0A4Q8M1F5_9GAMM|nr:AI-2E family transporter [Pseudoxanthomonas winnipegensis]RZZ86678.1 AI-2E family transporter [Pseudoxanthomonas winnipegensis]TAA08122.1 AI-2E family transporter [Pseudoxanthomonas winnipegensis]TAA21114.1 AI-2E family transporter [Pseudoxanthomonas winnipegensis]TAA38150.1 AI-2E family transporter [Pseudoxanthomonas winnipegensis]TAH72584.1 AI-2E family transporter [Pseudoxanthomonas winnipegensis]